MRSPFARWINSEHVEEAACTFLVHALARRLEEACRRLVLGGPHIGSDRPQERPHSVLRAQVRHTSARPLGRLPAQQDHLGRRKEIGGRNAAVVEEQKAAGS